MIAPAVARILADAILDGDDEALGILDVSRFEEDRLVPEPQLVYVYLFAGGLEPRGERARAHLCSCA